MIKIRRNCKEIEGRSVGAIKSVKTGEKQWYARFRSLKEASAKSVLCYKTILQPQQVHCEIATSLRNYFAAPRSRCKNATSLRNYFAKDGRFRRDTLIPQRLLLGCETVSQRSANFAEAAKSRRPLFLPCFCSIFAPKDFLSISLHFLLPEIIQKPILHQNKL